MDIQSVLALGVVALTIAVMMYFGLRKKSSCGGCCSKHETKSHSDTTP